MGCKPLMGKANRTQKLLRTMWSPFDVILDVFQRECINAKISLECNESAALPCWPVLFFSKSSFVSSHCSVPLAFTRSYHAESEVQVRVSEEQLMPGVARGD